MQRVREPCAKKSSTWAQSSFTSSLEFHHQNKAGENVSSAATGSQRIISAAATIIVLMDVYSLLKDNAEPWHLELFEIAAFKNLAADAHLIDPAVQRQAAATSAGDRRRAVD